MVNRVILGALGGADYGLKISAPGVEVTTSTDANTLFDSRWTDLVNVHASGSVTVTDNNVDGPTVTFTTLPYTPVVLTSFHFNSTLRASIGEWRNGALALNFATAPIIRVTSSDFIVLRMPPPFTGTPQVGTNRFVSYTFDYLVLTLPC